ncbi:hypothetical protein ES319_D05G413700v1 [Gossypium barbadense]|uniref:Secreted protein n=1 Tax=Gossypium barbadense TaxID=3634 RepID=A0A5J5RT12_GOSBA|nr:hypothetical protein ES319_D05G413700v1 [Gossypium barbadense]
MACRHIYSGFGFCCFFRARLACCASTYQQVRPLTAQAVAAPVVSWSRPQVGCIKYNIDTAFSENMQQASYGLVVRDKGGAFIREVTNPSVKHLTKHNETKLKK